MDEHDKKWVCFLKHDIQTPESCGLTKGWSVFCLAKGLKQHQRIQFGVMERNDNVLHYH